MSILILNSFSRFCIYKSNEYKIVIANMATLRCHKKKQTQNQFENQKVEVTILTREKQNKPKSSDVKKNKLTSYRIGNAK